MYKTKRGGKVPNLNAYLNAKDFFNAALNGIKKGRADDCGKTIQHDSPLAILKDRP